MARLYKKYQPVQKIKQTKCINRTVKNATSNKKAVFNHISLGMHNIYNMRLDDVVLE